MGFSFESGLCFLKDLSYSGFLFAKMPNLVGGIYGKILLRTHWKAFQHSIRPR